MSGRNMKISELSTMPNMSNALAGWEVSILVNRRVMTYTDGDASYTNVTSSIKGVRQPLKPEEIELKPEGQRSWSWHSIHVPTKYEQLNNDQIIVVAGRNHKIMGQMDWSLDGYVLYHAILDFSEVSSI